MVTRSEDRNQQIKNILNNLFNEVESNQYKEDSSFTKDIEKLFEGSTWGFREVMLIICLCRLFDPKYKASENLYKYNPRTLYPQIIKPFLDQKNIPNRKDSALNITKGISAINKEWAENRRPKNAAEKLVEINNKLENLTKSEVANFTKLLIRRFLQEAKVVKESNISINKNTDPNFLYYICKKLIDNTPDYGNTPQRIVGYFLESYHQDIGSDVVIEGHTDRASTSSTTSNKLGDITEELSSLNRTLLSYEVTVKKFDKERVVTAYEAAKDYVEKSKEEVNEIIVICRREDVPKDIESKCDSNLYLGKLFCKDIIFHFLDIYEWIMAQISRLSIDGRSTFFYKLQGYIHETNTSKTVKDEWAKLNPKN